MTKVLLRTEVRKFAERMELKLREHDKDRGSRGWLQLDVFWLAARIHDKHQELSHALLRPKPDVHQICAKAADVANFAMMVSDVVYQYGVQVEPGKTEQLGQQGLDALIVSQYSVGVWREREVFLERVVQRDGSYLWSIRTLVSCLNKLGEWEFEPLPSSRTDAFIKRCRWESAEDAFEFWRNGQYQAALNTKPL